MRRKLVLLWSVVLLVVSTGCSSASGPAEAGPPIPKYSRVVVVVEENHTESSIIGNPAAPFVNSLAGGGAVMTHSFAVAHPSEPNYLALFAGDAFGLESDACPLNYGDAPNLASELISAGYSFGGFAEGRPPTDPAACTAGAYVRRHVPWLSFSNVPASVSLPLGAFTGDARLPTVSFVVPDVDNDMHDGSIAAADTWLATHLSGYAAWAKENNSLLIVTWDEDDEKGDNHVATIFYGADVLPGPNDQPITHYNVLSTILQIYDLPKFGQTVSAAPVTGIWAS